MLVSSPAALNLAATYSAVAKSSLEAAMWGAAVSVFRCSPASLALGTARKSCSIFCSEGAAADWAKVELAAKENRTTAVVSSRRVNSAPKGLRAGRRMKSQITRKVLVVRRNEGASHSNRCLLRRIEGAALSSMSRKCGVKFPHTPAAQRIYYAATGTGWPQCEQRLAAAGISLRHSGQGFVGGGGGEVAVSFILAISVLTGSTTKK